MKKSSKEILNEKLLEAQQLMSAEQYNQCQSCIKSAIIANMQITAIPLPFVETIYVQQRMVKMIMDLGNIFDEDISQDKAKNMLEETGISVSAYSAIKLIPIYGCFGTISVVSLITEAIGWIIGVDMVKRYQSKQIKSQFWPPVIKNKIKQFGEWVAYTAKRPKEQHYGSASVDMPKPGKWQLFFKEVKRRFKIIYGWADVMKNGISCLADVEPGKLSRMLKSIKIIKISVVNH